MYPPTHIAFAYLVGRKFIPHPIKKRHLVFLGFMGVLPDVVDKTLHYQFGLFQSGRNVCHNIFLITSLFLIYSVLDDAKFKFYFKLALTGFATHLVGDYIQSILMGTYTDYSSISDWYLFALFPLYNPKLLPPAYDPIALIWETILIGSILVILIRDYKTSRNTSMDNSGCGRSLGRNY